MEIRFSYVLFGVVGVRFMVMGSEFSGHVCSPGRPKCAAKAQTVWLSGQR